MTNSENNMIDGFVRDLEKRDKHIAHLEKALILMRDAAMMRDHVEASECGFCEKTWQKAFDAFEELNLDCKPQNGILVDIDFMDPK